jgi:hypothetical protein
MSGQDEQGPDAAGITYEDYGEDQRARLDLNRMFSCSGPSFTLEQEGDRVALDPTEAASLAPRLAAWASANGAPPPSAGQAHRTCPRCHFSKGWFSCPGDGTLRMRCGACGEEGEVSR